MTKVVFFIQTYNIEKTNFTFSLIQANEIIHAKLEVFRNHKYRQKHTNLDNN